MGQAHVVEVVAEALLVVAVDQKGESPSEFHAHLQLDKRGAVEG
jgi:hypothetical protein